MKLRASSLAWLVLMLMLVGVPSRAQVLIGPDVDWTHWRFDDDFSDEWGNTLSMGGWGYNPGLRVGYLSRGGSVMLTADLALYKMDVGGGNLLTALAQPTISYVMMRDKAVSPYLGPSLGWYHSSGSWYGRSLTRPLVGGAAGVLHRVAAGHGLVRAEVRYGHYLQNPEGDGSYLADHLVSFRVGADLLLTR